MSSTNAEMISQSDCQDGFWQPEDMLNESVAVTCRVASKTTSREVTRNLPLYLCKPVYIKEMNKMFWSQNYVYVCLFVFLKNAWPFAAISLLTCLLSNVNAILRCRLSKRAGFQLDRSFWLLDSFVVKSWLFGNRIAIIAEFLDCEFEKIFE